MNVDTRTFTDAPMDHKTLATERSARLRLLVVLPLLGAGLLWASWPALRGMVVRWSHDPRYSHGFLVPMFAVYLLWQRRGVLASMPPASSWWGLPMIAAGAALRIAGARYYIDWVEAISLLPSLAGIALLVWGKRGLKWSWPAIGFLAFMVPLPYRAEVAMGGPLQQFATRASLYILQTFGLPALAEGNVILLGEHKIGVVDACNGLGMLFMFVAFGVAVALAVHREPLDRILIVLSSAPIAVGANVARIVLTGLLHETAGGKVAETVYHDLAGWLMMPMALAVLWLELLLLARLFREQAVRAPLEMVGIGPGRLDARDNRAGRQGRGSGRTARGERPESR